MHGRYGTTMMYVLAFTIDDGTGERRFRMKVRDPSMNVGRLVAGLRHHLPRLDEVRGP